MKLFSAVVNALWPRRMASRAEPDPAEMGTAFGLDSTITLLEPPTSSGWAPAGEATGRWHRQVTRPPRL